MTSLGEWLSGEEEQLAARVHPLKRYPITPETAAHEALTDPVAFRANLQHLGLKQAQITEALRLRDDTASQMEKLDTAIRDSYELQYLIAPEETPPEVLSMVRQKETLVQQLRDWIVGRRLRVERRAKAQLRLPLFVLSAASPEGCKANFALTRDDTQELSWEIRVFGSGFGGSTSFQVSASANFTADAGHVKVVFVPAVVPVEEVAVFKKDRRVGEGYRVDASKLKITAEPGLLLLRPGNYPPFGRFAKKYPIAGDTSGAIATYGYRYKRNVALQLSAGTKALGLDIGVKAKVEMTSSVALEYGLRGGFDYKLYFAAEGHGLIWGPLGP